MESKHTKGAIFYRLCIIAVALLLKLAAFHHDVYCKPLGGMLGVALAFNLELPIQLVAFRAGWIFSPFGKGGKRKGNSWGNADSTSRGWAGNTWIPTTSGDRSKDK
eukprot:363342-Karenia_brevis.AAC.2